VKEKRPAVADTGDLSGYDRFLLNALLVLAAEEAGRHLSAAFLEDLQQAKRARVNAKLSATRSRKQRETQVQDDAGFQWRYPSAKRRTPR